MGGDENSKLGAMGAVGDFDGDGIGDFVAGTGVVSSSSAASNHAGVLYGGRDRGFPPLFSSFVLSGDNGFEATGLSDFSCGSAGGNAADSNGDGLGDILIGWHLAGSTTGTGCVLGGSGGRRGGSFLNLDELGRLHGCSFTSVTSGSGRFGWSVAGVGGVNSGGPDDLPIGEADGDTGGPSSGDVHLIFGQDRLFGFGEDIGSPPANYRVGFFGVASIDPLGRTGLGPLGDVDGDGMPDFSIGTA